jgi:cupin fold WbuC family metalloprotein
MSLSTISLIELDPERVSEATGAKTAAFFCHRLPVRVDRAVIEELKLISNQRGKVNVRICLHEDPSANHHDMIALERRGRYYRPHKHACKGDTFHLLEGKLGIFAFDESGAVTDAVVLLPGEIYRTAVNTYHAILPLSEFVIHHENKPGPFEGSNDSIFPDWAPDGGNQIVADEYVRQLASRLPQAD